MRGTEPGSKALLLQLFVRPVRGALPLDKTALPLPPALHGPGAPSQGKGLRTMNTGYAMVFIAAAAVVVTAVAILVITALTS